MLNGDGSNIDFLVADSGEEIFLISCTCGSGHVLQRSARQQVDVWVPGGEHGDNGGHVRPVFRCLLHAEKPNLDVPLELGPHLGIRRRQRQGNRWIEKSHRPVLLPELPCLHQDLYRSLLTVARGLWLLITVLKWPKSPDELTFEIAPFVGLFLCPLRVSSRMTPKLYTSHFSVISPCKYSGDAYPLGSWCLGSQSYH